MNVSFKGFRNTGIGVDINKHTQQILKNNCCFIKPPYVHLSMTTTLNNIGDNDREIFSEILKKFPNKYQKDTINFHYDKYFSSLAQLFTKLSKAKELPSDKFYIQSDDCRANFNYFFMQDKKDLLEEFHSPDKVRKYAGDMTKEFYNIMTEYFNR